MRRVFSLFHEDAVQVPRLRPDKAYSAALIGLPGVGKSILIFLAALDQACTANVVYSHRESGEEEPASVFVMTPSSDGTSVRVWFTRNMESERLHRGLSTAANTLEDTLEGCRILQRSDFFHLVDGPRHGDIADPLDGDYDYLCPSGGIPRYKNDEFEKRVWVLDGWREDEAVTALVALHNQSPSAAQQAYFLCGGIIRSMQRVCSCSASSYADVKRQLDELVAHCDKESVELYVGGTGGRGNDPSNPDRLRTMFEQISIEPSIFRDKRRNRVCHMVDSPYLIEKLYATLPRKRWEEACQRIV